MQQLIKTVVFEGTKTEQIALDYDNNDTIINYNIQNKYALLLTQKGDVYKIGDITSSKSLIQDFSKEKFLQHRPVRFLGLNKEKIIQISCSSTVGLLLSQSGSIFACGNDTNRSGILGFGNETNLLSSPQIIPTFQRKSMKYISVGEKHAAAIDTKGQLYTWGSGSCEELGFQGNIKQQIPTKVNIKELYGTQKVFTQNNLTAVLTQGGSLFFMGNIEKGNQKVEKIGEQEQQQQNLNSDDIILHKPSNELDLYFKSIVIKNEFVFALSNKYELYFINKNYQCQKYLYPSQTLKFKQIFSSSSKIFAFIEKETNQQNQLYEWDILQVNKHPFIKANQNLLKQQSPQKSSSKNNKSKISKNTNNTYDLAQIDIASLPPEIQTFHQSISSLDVVSSQQSRLACIQFYQHQSLSSAINSNNSSQQQIPIFQTFTDTPIGGGSGKLKVPQFPSFFQNQDQLNQSISQLDNSTYSRNPKKGRSASKSNAKDLINSVFPSKEDRDQSILSNTQRSSVPRQQSYSLQQRQQNRQIRQQRKESENQNPDTSRYSSLSKSHISRLDGFEQQILIKKQTLKNRNQNNAIQNENANLSKSFFNNQDPHNVSHSYTDQNILNDQSVFQGSQNRFYFNLNNSQNNSMLFQQGTRNHPSIDMENQRFNNFLSPDAHSANQSIHDDSQGESSIQRQIRQMKQLHKKQQLDDSMHDYEHQYNIKERADALRQSLIQNNIHSKVDSFIKMSPNRTKLFDESNISHENSDRKQSRNLMNPQRVEQSADDFENYQKKQQQIVQQNIIKKYQKQAQQQQKQPFKRDQNLFRRNSFLERWNKINSQQLQGKPGEVGRPLEYFLKLIEGKNEGEVNELLKGLNDEFRTQSEDPHEMYKNLQDSIKQSYITSHKKKPSYSLENKYNSRLSEQENESDSSNSDKQQQQKPQKYKLSGLSSSNNNSQNSSFNKKINKKSEFASEVQSSDSQLSSQINSDDSEETKKRKQRKRKNKQKQQQNQKKPKKQSYNSSQSDNNNPERKKSDLNDLLDKFNNQSPLQSAQNQPEEKLSNIPQIPAPKSKSQSKIQNIKNKIELIRQQKQAKSKERQQVLNEMQEQQQNKLNKLDQEKQKRNEENEQQQQQQLSQDDIDNIRNSTYQKRRKCDNLSQDSNIPQGFIESEKEKGFKKNIGDTFTPIEPKSPLMVFQSSNNPQTQNQQQNETTPFQNLQQQQKPLQLERQGSFGSQPQNTSDMFEGTYRKASDENEILPHFPALQKEDLIDLKQYEEELNKKDPKLKAIEEKTERAIQAVLDDKTFNPEQKKHFITALTTKSPQKSGKKHKKEFSVIDEEQEEDGSYDNNNDLQQQEELADYILNKQKQKEDEKHDLQQLIQEMGGENIESNINTSHEQDPEDPQNTQEDEERRKYVIKLMKVENMDEEKKGQFIKSLVQQYSPIKPNRIVEDIDEIEPTMESNDDSLKEKTINQIENSVQLSPEQKRKLTESVSNISNFDKKDKKQIDNFLKTKKKQTPAQQKLEEIQEVLSQNEELVKSLVSQQNPESQEKIIQKVLENSKIENQNPEEIQQIIHQVLNDDQLESQEKKQEIIQKLIEDSKQQEVHEFLQSQSNLRQRNDLSQSQVSPIDQLKELATKDTKIQKLAKSLVQEQSPQKKQQQNQQQQQQTLRKSSSQSLKQEDKKNKLKQSLANQKIAKEILQQTNQPISDENKQSIVKILEDTNENPEKKQNKIVQIIQKIEQGQNIQEIAQKDNTVLSKSLSIKPEDKLQQLTKSSQNIKRLAKQITDKDTTPEEQEHIIEEILEQVDNKDNEESKQILRQILSDDTIPTQSQRKKFIEESVKHLQDEEIQNYLSENPELQNRIINKQIQSQKSLNPIQNQNQNQDQDLPPQKQLELIISQDQKANRLAKMYSKDDETLTNPEKRQEQQQNILKESGIPISKSNTQALSKLIDDPELSEEEQQDLIKEFINQGQQGIPLEEIEENLESIKRKGRRIKKSKTTPAQKLEEIQESEKNAKTLAKSLLIKGGNNQEQIQEFLHEAEIPQTQENENFVKSILEKPTLNPSQKQQMLDQLISDSMNKQVDQYLEENKNLNQQLKKSLKQSNSPNLKDSKSQLQQLVKQQQRASSIAKNIIEHQLNPASASPEEQKQDSEELLQKVIKEAELQETPFTQNLINNILQNNDPKNPLNPENQKEIIEEIINQGKQGKNPQEIVEAIEKVKRSQRKRNISKSQYQQNITPKQKIEQIKQQQAKSKQLVQSLVFNNQNQEPQEKEELIKNLLESNQQELSQQNVQQLQEVLDNKLKTPQQKSEILSEIIESAQNQQMQEYINQNPNYQKRVKKDPKLQNSQVYDQIKQISQEERRASKLAQSYISQQNPQQNEENYQEICEEAGFKPTQKNKDLVKSLLVDQQIAPSPQDKQDLIKEIIQKGKQGEEIQQIVQNKVKQMVSVTPQRKDSSQFFNTNTSQIQDSVEKSQNLSIFHPQNQNNENPTPTQKLQEIEKIQDNISQIIKKLVNIPTSEEQTIQILTEDLLDQVNENNNQNQQTIINILNDPKLKNKSQKTQQIEDLIGHAIDQEIADFISETVEEKPYQQQKVQKLSQSGYTPQEQLEELSKAEKKTKKIVKSALKQSQNMPSQEIQSQLAKSVLKEAQQPETVQNIELMKEVLQENNNTLSKEEKLDLLVNIVDESKNQEKDLFTVIQEKKQEQLENKRKQAKQNKRLSKTLKPNEKIQELQEKQEKNKQLTQSLLQTNEILQQKLEIQASTNTQKPTSYIDQAQRKKDQQEINKLKKTTDEILENILENNIKDNPVEQQQQKEAIQNLINNPDINTNQKQEIIEDILHQTQEQEIANYLDNDHQLHNRKNKLSKTQVLLPSQQLQEIAERDKKAKRLAKSIVYKGEFDEKQIQNLLKEGKLENTQENQQLIKQVLSDSQLNQNPSVLNTNQQAQIIQEIINRGQAGDDLQEIISDIKENETYNKKQLSPQEMLENYEITQKQIKKQTKHLINSENPQEQKHIIEEILETANQEKNVQNQNIFQQILQEPETSQKEKEQQINQLLESELQQQISDYIKQSLIIKKSNKQKLSKSNLPPSQQLEKIIEQQQKQQRLVKSIAQNQIPNEKEQINQILQQGNLEKSQKNQNLIQSVLKQSNNNPQTLEKLVSQIYQSDEPLEEIVQDVLQQQNKNPKSFKSLKSLTSINSQTPNSKPASSTFAEKQKLKTSTTEKLEQIQSIQQKQKEIAKSLVKEKDINKQQELIHEFLDQTQQNNPENQETIQKILEDPSLITPSQKQEVLHDLINNEAEIQAQNFIQNEEILHPRIQNIHEKSPENMSTTQILEELAYQDQKAKNTAKSIILQSKTSKKEIDVNQILKEAGQEQTQENQLAVSQLLEEQAQTSEKPYKQQENQEILIEEIIKQGQAGIPVQVIVEQIANTQQDQYQNQEFQENQENMDNIPIPPQQKLEQIQNKKSHSQNMIKSLLDPTLPNEQQKETLVNLLKSENLHNEQNEQVISQILQDESIKNPQEKEEIISNLLLKTEEDEIQDYLVQVAQQDPVSMNILNNLASQGLQPQEQLHYLAEIQNNHQKTISQVINDPKNQNNKNLLLNQILENASPQQQQDKELQSQISQKIDQILQSSNNLDDAQQEALIKSLTQAVAQGEDIQMFSVKDITKSKTQSLNTSQLQIKGQQQQKKPKKPTKNDQILEKAFKHNMDQVQQKYQLIQTLINPQDQNQQQEEFQKHIIDQLLQEGQPNIEQKKKLMLNIVQDQKIQNDEEKADLLNEIIDTGFLDTQKQQIKDLVSNFSKNNLKKQEDLDNLQQQIANLIVKNAEYAENHFLENLNEEQQQQIMHPNDPETLEAQKEIIQEIILQDNQSQQEKIKSIISAIKPQDQLTEKNKKRLIKSLVSAQGKLNSQNQNVILDRLLTSNNLSNENIIQNNNQYQQQQLKDENTKQIIQEILQDHESDNQVKQNMISSIILGENQSKSQKEKQKTDKKIEYLANNDQPDEQVISSLLDQNQQNNNYKQLINEVILNQNIEPQEKQVLIKSLVSQAQENQTQNPEEKIEKLLNKEENLTKPEKTQIIKSLAQNDKTKERLIKSVISNQISEIPKDSQKRLINSILLSQNSQQQSFKNPKIQQKLQNISDAIQNPQLTSLQQNQLLENLLENQDNKNLKKSLIKQQILEDKEKTEQEKSDLIKMIVLNKQEQQELQVENILENPQQDQQQQQQISELVNNPIHKKIIQKVIQSQDFPLSKKKSLVQSIIKKSNISQQNTIESQENLKKSNMIATLIDPETDRYQQDLLLNELFQSQIIDEKQDLQEIESIQAKKELIQSIISDKNADNLQKSEVITNIIENQIQQQKISEIINQTENNQNQEENDQILEQIEQSPKKRKLINSIIQSQNIPSPLKNDMVNKVLTLSSLKNQEQDQQNQQNQNDEIAIPQETQNVIETLVRNSNIKQPINQEVNQLLTNSIIDQSNLRNSQLQNQQIQNILQNEEISDNRKTKEIKNIISTSQLQKQNTLKKQASQIIQSQKIDKKQQEEISEVNNELIKSIIKDENLNKEEKTELVQEILENSEQSKQQEQDQQFINKLVENKSSSKKQEIINKLSENNDLHKSALNFVTNSDKFDKNTKSSLIKSVHFSDKEKNQVHSFPSQKSQIILSKFNQQKISQLVENTDNDPESINNEENQQILEYLVNNNNNNQENNEVNDEMEKQSQLMLIKSVIQDENSSQNDKLQMINEITNKNNQIQQQQQDNYKKLAQSHKNSPTIIQGILKNSTPEVQSLKNSIVKQISQQKAPESLKSSLIQQIIHQENQNTQEEEQKMPSPQEIIKQEKINNIIFQVQDTDDKETESQIDQLLEGSQNQQLKKSVIKSIVKSQEENIQSKQKMVNSILKADEQSPNIPQQINSQKQSQKIQKILSLSTLKNQNQEQTILIKDLLEENLQEGEIDPLQHSKQELIQSIIKDKKSNNLSKELLISQIISQDQVKNQDQQIPGSQKLTRQQSQSLKNSQINDPKNQILKTSKSLVSEYTTKTQKKQILRNLAKSVSSKQNLEKDIDLILQNDKLNQQEQQQIISGIIESQQLQKNIEDVLQNPNQNSQKQSLIEILENNNIQNEQNEDQVLQILESKSIKNEEKSNLIKSLVESQKIQQNNQQNQEIQLPENTENIHEQVQQIISKTSSLSQSQLSQTKNTNQLGQQELVKSILVNPQTDEKQKIRLVKSVISSSHSLKNTSQSQIQQKNLKKRLIQSILSQDSQQENQQQKQQKLEQLLISKKSNQSQEEEQKEMIEQITNPHTNETTKQNIINQLISQQSLNEDNLSQNQEISNTESDLDQNNNNNNLSQQNSDSDLDLPFLNNNNNENNNFNNNNSKRNSILQEQVDKQQKLEEIISQNNLILEEKKKLLISLCENDNQQNQEIQSQQKLQEKQEKDLRNSQIIENLLTKSPQISHNLLQKYLKELVGNAPEKTQEAENIINNPSLSHQQKYSNLKLLSQKNNKEQEKDKLINSLVYETGNKQNLINSLTENIQENKDEKKSLIDHIIKDKNTNISMKEKLISTITQQPPQQHLDKKLAQSIINQKSVQKPEDKKRLIQSLIQNTPTSQISQQEKTKNTLEIEQILQENNLQKKQSLTNQLLNQQPLMQNQSKNLIQKLLSQDSKKPIELNQQEQEQATDALLSDSQQLYQQQQYQQQFSSQILNKSNSQQNFYQQSPNKSLNQSQISNQSIKKQSEKKINKLLEQSQNLEGEEQDQKIEEAKNLLRLSQSFRNSEKSNQSPLKKSLFKQSSKNTLSPIKKSIEELDQEQEEPKLDIQNLSKSPTQGFPKFMNFNDDFEGEEEATEKVKRKGLRSSKFSHSSRSPSKATTPIYQQEVKDQSQNQKEEQSPQISPQAKQQFKKSGLKSSYIQEQIHENKEQKSPSKFKLAVLKIMSSQEESPQKEKKFDLKQAAKQLLEQHTKSPKTNEQQQQNPDQKPKKTLKEKAEQLKQTILSKKDDSPILPKRQSQSQLDQVSQVQSLNTSQLQQLQNQQLRNSVSPVHLQRNNSNLSKQLRETPIQRQQSTNKISSQHNLNDSQNISRFQESPIRLKSPNKNAQNLQESMFSNPINNEDKLDNTLNQSQSSQKIQYLQQLRQSQSLDKNKNQNQQLFKGKSKKTIDSILQNQQEREKSLLKQGSEIIKDNIDLNKEISLDNSFSQSPNRLIGSLIKSRSLNTSQIQNKLSNSTSNPQLQRLQSYTSNNQNQQQFQESFNNPQLQQQQNVYNIQVDPINQILKPKTPSRSPSHRSLRDQGNQTLNYLDNQQQQQQGDRFYSPQRRVIQPNTYKSNYPILNSPTHQELSELIDRECDEITNQFMQKVFPHRPLGNNQSFNLNITNQSMFQASPFKNLRKNDKVGLVVLMKLEKFLLKRKYHAFILMKLLYKELKAKELQKEESLMQPQEPVYAFQKQQLVQKKIQQESDQNKLMIRKKEGYARLAIALNNIVNSRKKQTLDKIADEHKLLMSYNLFNLLLTNFGKIFQNNIHKKLQYSFSKIYYFNRQSQVNSQHITQNQSMNSSIQNIQQNNNNKLFTPFNSSTAFHKQHIQKINDEIQHLNEQIMQSQQQQDEYTSQQAKQQKTNELLNLCQNVIQGQKPLLSQQSPSSSQINTSKLQQNESQLNEQQQQQQQQEEDNQDNKILDNLNERIKNNLISPSDKTQSETQLFSKQIISPQAFSPVQVSDRKSTQRQIQQQQQNFQKQQQKTQSEKNIIFNKQKNRPLTAQEIKRMQYMQQQNQSKSPNTTLNLNSSTRNIKQPQNLNQSMSTRSKFQQQQQQQQDINVSVVAKTQQPQHMQKSHSSQSKQLQSSLNQSAIQRAHHDPAAQKRLYGPQQKSFGQTFSKPPPRMNTSLQPDMKRRQGSQQQLFKTQNLSSNQNQILNQSLMQQQQQQQDIHQQSFNQSNILQQQQLEASMYQQQQQIEQIKKQELEDIDTQIKQKMRQNQSETSQQKHQQNRNPNLNKSVNVINNPNDKYQPTVFYNKPTKTQHGDYNKYYK